MKYTFPICFIFLTSIIVNAQITFTPEFEINKLNTSDDLINLFLFDEDVAGEKIIAGFMNNSEHNVRVIKYSLTGAVVQEKSFSLAESEKYISGNLFRLNNITYFLSASSFTIDSLKTIDSTTMVTKTVTVNYISLKLYNYESKELLDSTRCNIGANLEEGSYKDSLKLRQINFIFIPAPLKELSIAYLGLHLEYKMEYASFSRHDQETQILKLSIKNSRIISAAKISDCGNDFFYRDGAIISSGYNRDQYWGGVSDHHTNHFILKSENDFTSLPETLYAVKGGRYAGRLGHTYKKYISNFNGLFNNFPKNSEYSPLFWYSGYDTYDSLWNGQYFLLYDKHFSELKYRVPGNFCEECFNEAHTYLELDDSSEALLYFTKSGSRITYSLRRISDGHLIYSDSDGSFLPDYIVKTKEGKQYFLQSHMAGLRVYSIKVEIKLGDDDIPTVYKLNQNFPNPFNNTTRITYSIPRQSYVTLKIYDIIGNEVATPVNQVQDTGTYDIIFNATSLSSGVFIYSIQAGTFRQSKKLLIIK